MIPEWNIQTVTFTLPPAPPTPLQAVLHAWREMIAEEEQEAR